MIVLVIYLIGLPVVWVISGRMYIEYQFKGNYKKELSDDDRLFAMLTGFLCGMGWPILAIGYPLYRLMFARYKPPSQKLKEKQEELERIKKLSKEHNLPGFD